MGNSWTRSSVSRGQRLHPEPWVWLRELPPGHRLVLTLDTQASFEPHSHHLGCLLPDRHLSLSMWGQVPLLPPSILLLQAITIPRLSQGKTSSFCFCSFHGQHLYQLGQFHLCSLSLTSQLISSSSVFSCQWLSECGREIIGSLQASPGSLGYSRWFLSEYLVVPVL